MQWSIRVVMAVALGVLGCGDAAGAGGSGGAAGDGGHGGHAGSAGGDGGHGGGGTGGSAEQCDDGTEASYDSMTCDRCVACAIEGPCPQCSAQACQDFLRCALPCLDIDCTADCIDRNPTGAVLFGEAFECALCDACPNNCGFPPPPFWCDPAGMTCFQDDECTNPLICCQLGSEFEPGACVTQTACDELQGGSVRQSPIGTVDLRGPFPDLVRENSQLGP